MKRIRRLIGRRRCRLGDEPEVGAGSVHSPGEFGPEADAGRRLTLSISALPEDRREAVLQRVRTAQRALGLGKVESSGRAVGAVRRWRPASVGASSCPWSMSGWQRPASLKGSSP